MTEHPNRQPKGTPTGGQFAASEHAEAEVDLRATQTPTGTCPSCFAERPHPLSAGGGDFLPGSVCPHCGHIELNSEIESDDSDWLVTLDDQGTIRAIDEHGNTEEVLGIDDPEWDRYADLFDVDRDRVKAALEHANAEAGEAFAESIDDGVPDSVEAARRWVTADVERLFDAEIANEREGGVTPATVSSTIDSVAQGLPFAEGTDVPAVLTSLLVIRDLVPGDTEVRDLLPGTG